MNAPAPGFTGVAEGGPPRFTVFTPTYQRRRTLPGVFASLCAQTLRDFEWLIVDDGSTDGTADAVREWAAVAPFPVRYIWQPNGGKHRAFNRGVAEARGRLFVPLDSDDVCLPNALERFAALWDEIPAERRERLSGITVHCEDFDGRLMGLPFPAPVLDSTPMALLAAGGLVGDKWGFHRTDVLRRFPFPEFPGERFVPESVVWNRIARSYGMRYVNEVLQRKEYQDDGLTRASVRIRMQSPRGTALTYRELLGDPLTVRFRWRTLINYVRFMRHAGAGPREILRGGSAVRFGWLALPLGAAAALADAVRAARRHRAARRAAARPVSRPR